jgi:hypothetical protein
MKRFGRSSLVMGFALVACGPQSARQPRISGIDTQTSVVDFGLTFCGETSDIQNVLFDFVAEENHSWTASLQRGTDSPFSLAADGNVPRVTRSLSPGSQGSTGVQIYPKPLPREVIQLPGDFGDTLTVTTDIQGAGPFVVVLKQGAKGVRLRWSTTSISFGKVAVGQRKAVSPQLINDGNVDAELQLDTSGVNDFGVWPNIRTSFKPGEEEVQITFAPQSTGYQNDVVYLPWTYTPACGPAPGSVTVGGTGT